MSSRDTCHAAHGSFLVYGPVKNIQKSTMTKQILNNNNNMLRKHIKLNWFIETYWKQIENVIEKNAKNACHKPVAQHMFTKSVAIL